MPMYEYRCPSCGGRHERLRRTAERDAPSPCPDCGADAERALSAFALGRAAGASTATASPAACYSGG